VSAASKYLATHGPTRHAVAMCDISDPQFDQIACSQFAVNRQIEQRVGRDWLRAIAVEFEWPLCREATAAPLPGDLAFVCSYIERAVIDPRRRSEAAALES